MCGHYASQACMPAMRQDLRGLVIGQATVQRYIDPSLNSGLGYRHYSSPVFSTASRAPMRSPRKT